MLLAGNRVGTAPSADQPSPEWVGHLQWRVFALDHLALVPHKHATMALEAAMAHELVWGDAVMNSYVARPHARGWLRNLVLAVQTGSDVPVFVRWTAAGDFRSVLRTKISSWY